MPASAELVARSADLKRELTEYAQGPDQAQALQDFIAERFEGETPDDDQSTNAIDVFVLQHQLADGRTPVEHFVAAHPELSDAEQKMLLRWREVVEGVFAIQRRDTDALLLDSLIDELMYRVRANTGPNPFAKLKEGSFLLARLVPVQDEWLLSGACSTFTRSQRDLVYRVAAELAEATPPLVFRNPANVARAWEQQGKEREEFIAFFGSDLVVLPGAQVDERMRAYANYQVYEVRDAEGKTVAERAKRVYGAMPPLPEPDLPEGIGARETVGVVFDEVDGLKFLPDFGLVQETFANPDLAADDRHREAVRSYLDDATISPRVLQRLAEPDPERASRVMGQLLGQPDFSWEQEGEAMLQRAKASYFERPVMPGIVPLSEELARAKLGVAPSFAATVSQRASRASRASKRKKRR
jgi:hypothetical protein